MKEVVKFFGELKHENTLILLDALQAGLEDEGEVVLYFTSSGGDICESDVITDFINNNWGNIEMVFSGVIGSAAFEIFLNVICKKRLLPFTYGIIHKGTVDLPSMGIDCKGSVTYFEKKFIDEFNKKIIDRYKKLVSSHQIKRMLNGQDVFVDNDTMRKVAEGKIKW